MNKKLRKALSDRCKDMGLTQLAIDRLTELGGEGLAEDAPEEDINAKADTLVPYAKAMQSEVTRKTSSAKTQSTAQQSAAKGEGDKGEGEGEDEKEKQEQVPGWAKQLQKDLADLRQENAELKAARAKADRAALISEKARQLNIPGYLMKRITIADDADIDKELTELRQELVNNGLAPMEQGAEPGSSQKALEAEADEWIKANYGVE